MRALCLLGWLVWVGCEFPRPTEVADAPSSMDVDAGCRDAECPLGCVAGEDRCRDVAPSNGLGSYLDMAASEPAADLGAKAVINTDNGSVMVDGNPVALKSAIVTQLAAPSIRVLIVQRLVVADVTVTGSLALAIVSNDEIRIMGTLSGSARSANAGPGRLNDPACKGGDAVLDDGRATGGGGGGFGSSGGTGGNATNLRGSNTGGAAGAVAGTVTLTPLRGGCDGGAYNGTAGAGGGAIQLVSRTLVTVGGIVATNGSCQGSGGSGGGILIEAPVVNVTGAMVANGGAGAGGCFIPILGEDGRMDDQPAMRGASCVAGANGDGGRGAARAVPAGNGANGSTPNGSSIFAGHAGGGVGRIRINTTSGGLHTTGIFSPEPSTGEIATR